MCSITTTVLKRAFVIRLRAARNLCYKKVGRPDEFKLVSRPVYEAPSLAEVLRERIRTGGPISVAEYMRCVVSHPRHGYYTSQGRPDVFGQSGDFTTSPEISPLFGELIGVWMSHELRKVGSPRPLRLIELGPGRGTLMADILRVFQQLPPGHADFSVHLVEISEHLARIQAQRLGAVELTTGAAQEETDCYQHAVMASGHHVHWYKQLRHVPTGQFSVVLAHEFFDALPIHKLQKVDGTWREVLLTLKAPESASAELEFVVSRVGNPTVSALIAPGETREHVEVSLEAAQVMTELATRLLEDGGVSLIVDYGHSGDRTDTFRGFKAHALHDPLSAPGTADLTADVDFALLTRAAGPEVVTYGPVSQRDFLTRLGIQQRLEMLCAQHPSQAAQFTSGVKMITEDMGQRFQMLAMFPGVLKDHLLRYPVAGFSDPA